jgi:hypothetical protein
MTDQDWVEDVVSGYIGKRRVLRIRVRANQHEVEAIVADEDDSGPITLQSGDDVLSEYERIAARVASGPKIGESDDGDKI